MSSCMERMHHNKPNADDNGISCGTADEDGIMITENQNGNGIYIYYSERSKHLDDYENYHSLVLCHMCAKEVRNEK